MTSRAVMTQRCILGSRSEKHRGQGGSPEAQRPTRRKSLCTWIPEDLEAISARFRCPYPLSPLSLINRNRSGINGY
jgi:hypothetical protein